MKKELTYHVDHEAYELEIIYMLDYEHQTRDSPGHFEIEVIQVYYTSRWANDPKKSIDFTDFYFDYIHDCFEYDLEQDAKEYLYD